MVCDWIGWVACVTGVAGVTGSIHINSTVLFFLFLFVFSFSFVFVFVFAFAFVFFLFSSCPLSSDHICIFVYFIFEYFQKMQHA
jgi:hypothetical protein